MRFARRVAFCLLAAAPALAQDSPEQQARRLLEDGRAYWAQGKMKQALDNFNIVVASFPNTDSVGQALLEIGRYRMEVEGDQERARASFEEVAKKHPHSDGAPGAYYYLGMLTLTRGTTPAEMDDALAQFTRVQNLYPRSSWVPRAIYASGLVHRKGGRLAEAVEAERRVSLEYPSSEAAPSAQYEIGQCLALMGEPFRAMEEFQQVRNRFPESEWAQKALDRITALYRLHGSGKPAFAHDPSFSLAVGDALKEVRAILMTPTGTFWIASEKTRSALAVEPTGKVGTSLGAEELRTLALSPRGEIVLASKLAVRIGLKDIRSFSVPSDKPGIPEPLEKIQAATLTPAGSVLVADDKRRRVYRFDPTFNYQGTFPDGKEREVTRLLLDGEGGIVMLDRAEKTVRVFDEAGKVLRSVGPGGLRRPVDVAIDPFRNFYVADEEGGVHIFTAQGQLMATIAGTDLKRPRAVTLDATGAILVYDERAEKVLRYQ